MNFNQWVWFLKTSYSYIHPRGIFGHVKFALGLPMASIRYRRCILDQMRYEFK
jgi:hypothetical protein